MAFLFGDDSMEECNGWPADALPDDTAGDATTSLSDQLHWEVIDSFREHHELPKHSEPSVNQHPVGESAQHSFSDKRQVVKIIHDFGSSELLRTLPPFVPRTAQGNSGRPEEVLGYQGSTDRSHGNFGGMNLQYVVDSQGAMDFLTQTDDQSGGTDMQLKPAVSAFPTLSNSNCGGLDVSLASSVLTFPTQLNDNSGSREAQLASSAIPFSNQLIGNSRQMELQVSSSSFLAFQSPLSGNPGMEVDEVVESQDLLALPVATQQNLSTGGPPSKKARAQSASLKPIPKNGAIYRSQHAPHSCNIDMPPISKARAKSAHAVPGPAPKRVPKTVPPYPRPQHEMVIGEGLLTSTQFFKAFLALGMCKDPRTRAKLKIEVNMLTTAGCFVKFATCLNNLIGLRRVRVQRTPSDTQIPSDTQMSKVRLFVRSRVDMKAASLNDMLLGFKGYEGGAIKGTPFPEIHDGCLYRHVTLFPLFTPFVKRALLLFLEDYALDVEGTANWVGKKDVNGRSNSVIAGGLEGIFTPQFFEEFLSRWSASIHRPGAQDTSSGVAHSEESSDDVMSDNRDDSGTLAGGAHARQGSPHCRWVSVPRYGKPGNDIDLINPRYLGNPQQFLTQYLPSWAKMTVPGTRHRAYNVKLFVAHADHSTDRNVDVITSGDNLANTTDPLGDHNFIIVVEKCNPPLKSHKDGLVAGTASAAEGHAAPRDGTVRRTRGGGPDRKQPTFQQTHTSRQRGSSEDSSPSSSPQECISVNSDCSEGELIPPLSESGDRLSLSEGSLGFAVQPARAAVNTKVAEITWSLHSPPKVTLVVRMDPFTIPRLFLHLSGPAHRESVGTMPHFDFTRQRVEGETFLESVCCDLFARKLEVVGHPWRVRLSDLHINHPPILRHKVTLEEDQRHFCTATDADGKPRHVWDYVRKGIERMRLGWRCGNNQAHTCLGVERCPTDQFEIYAATQSDAPMIGLCFECGAADAPARVQAIASFECCGCEATSDVDGCIVLMPPLVSVKEGQLSARSGAPIADPYTLQFEPCSMFEKVAGMDPQNTSGPLHNERATAPKHPSRPLSYTDRESGPRHEKVENLISKPATSQRVEDDSVGEAPDSKKALYTHVAKTTRHAGLRSAVDVLISYSSRFDSDVDDKRGEQFLREIDEIFRSKRWTLYHGLLCPPGSDWDKEWFGRIQVAKVALLLITPAYLQSKQCLEELYILLKSPLKNTLVPVIVHDVAKVQASLTVEQMQATLRSLQYHDWELRANFICEKFKARWLPRPSEGCFLDHRDANTQLLLSSLQRLVSNSPLDQGSSDKPVLLIIGPTGAGKSSVANAVAKCVSEREPTFAFEEGKRIEAQTEAPAHYDAGPVIIVDTPGLSDPRGQAKDEAHVRGIVDYVNDRFTFVHVVLVLDGGAPRLDSGLQEALTLIFDTLGSAMLQHTFAVFTKSAKDEDVDNQRDKANEIAKNAAEHLKVEVAPEFPILNFDCHPERDANLSAQAVARRQARRAEAAKAIVDWAHQTQPGLATTGLAYAEYQRAKELRLVREEAERATLLRREAEERIVHEEFEIRKVPTGNKERRNRPNPEVSIVPYKNVKKIKYRTDEYQEVRVDLRTKRTRGSGRVEFSEWSEGKGGIQWEIIPGTEAGRHEKKKFI